MSLFLPKSLLLVLGVVFIATGVGCCNGKSEQWMKIFFNATGAALIIIWANIAGLE